MLQFNKNFAPNYDEVQQISPLVHRLVAHNPSPFTFHGTGTYIIGREKVAVIDPGPAIASHIHGLERFLKNKVVSHILVTHNHVDHSPAAHPLKLVTGADIYAFDVAGQADIDNHAEEGRDQDFTPDHLLHDGDVIQGGDWTLDVVHTPGHLSNHLCFGLRQEKALFTGDHVMGWSTSVVSQPDGDMKDYLTSLKKILGRDDRIYYPTHGGPIEDPHPFVKGLIKHREQREQQIIKAIAGGATTISQMVAVIYSDVPTFLHPAAASSVLSHLIHMTDDGRIRCQGDLNGGGVYTIV